MTKYPRHWVAAHEAGHFVVALHYRVAEKAEVWVNGDIVDGAVSYSRDALGLPISVRREIAIAGAVAEEYAAAKDLCWQDEGLIAWASDSDLEAAGWERSCCPADELDAAAAKVREALSGPLRQNWLGVTKALTLRRKQLRVGVFECGGEWFKWTPDGSARK